MTDITMDKKVEEIIRERCRQTYKMMWEDNAELLSWEDLMDAVGNELEEEEIINYGDNMDEIEVIVKDEFRLNRWDMVGTHCTGNIGRYKLCNDTSYDQERFLPRIKMYIDNDYNNTPVLPSDFSGSLDEAQLYENRLGVAHTIEMVNGEVYADIEIYNGHDADELSKKEWRIVKLTEKPYEVEIMGLYVMPK